MTSKIVVNNIEPDAGISTVTVNGDCQATTFKGDGSNLTGIDATSIKNGSDVKVQANASGAVVTGILTANSISIADGGAFINKHSVGIGTTNTAGRNAGVSTATGTLIYNTTTESLEFYTGNLWVATNLIPFLNSVTGDILNGSATNLVINASNITDSVSVKYSNNSSGSVIATDASPSISGSNVTSTVPSAVYGTSVGTVVKIEVVNSDGTASSNSLTKTIVAAPSGGTKTTAGGYTYHTFNSNGNFVNTLSSLSVEFLLVAGGAIDGTATLSAATYAIQIGGGGSGGKRVQGPEGTQGGDSTFNSNTAIGGGRGVDYGGTAHPGGVGTGGDIPNAFSGGSGAGAFRGGNPGAGTAGQGNAGGYGGSYNNGSAQAAGGGGGGGKGSVGGNGNSSGVGGNGGSGINWKSLGTFYAGGGGGGGDTSNSQTGTAGSGTHGGGNGTNGGTQSNNSNHATANRGGGGGATGGNVGSNVFYQGSNGGSGICIIRYQL